MKRSRHANDFNQYILLSVEKLATERGGGGYNINSYFTQRPGLVYGHDRYVGANNPPLTMCVAAVAEIIIEALNIYAAKTGDYTPFQRLPMRSWNGGSVTDIRPYVFMFDNVQSNGTADALTKFGIGRHLPFEGLLPGDFINLNRTSGSGHATVFLSFININYDDEETYSNRVVGFKYFSAQGKGKPDAGLAYRWAFFSPHCPAEKSNRPRDCNIIFSHNQSVLNNGRMASPSAWTIEHAVEKIRTDYLASRFRALVGRRAADKDLPALRANTAVARFARALVDLEIAEASGTWDPSRLDGITTD
jgi:hypothetical protein